MKKEKKWYEKPYAQTRKSVDESISDIKKLLNKYEIEAIQDTRFRDQINIRFILIENDKKLPFEFTIKLPSNSEPKAERKQRQYIRAYYYYIKSRVELISDFGIKSFSEEFATDRILKLPNGQIRSIGQIIKDQEGKLNNAELYLPFQEG